jgi:hypothetical protein
MRIKAAPLQNLHRCVEPPREWEFFHTTARVTNQIKRALGSSALAARASQNNTTILTFAASQDSNQHQFQGAARALLYYLNLLVLGSKHDKHGLVILLNRSYLSESNRSQEQKLPFAMVSKDGNDLVN